MKYLKIIFFGVIFSWAIFFSYQQVSAIGQIGLDRSVYPLPTEQKDLIVTIQIFDLDFDISPNGVDSISENIPDKEVGPVKISVKRFGNQVILGYAGGESSKKGKIDSEPLAKSKEDLAKIRQFGPIKEISPTSAIFEFDIAIKNSDGPQSSECPNKEVFAGLGDKSGPAEVRFDDTSGSANHCILQGDVLTVEYTDPTDSSGNPRTTSASARFELNDPQFRSPSTVFRIGHPFTLVVDDPDLNLDADEAESYSLNLITFRSDKIRINLGDKAAKEAFDPKPTVLRETGDNTGVFYTIMEMPRMINGRVINLGEEIEFEYRDIGTVASGFVGGNVEDFTLEGQISNRGAVVDLEKAKEEVFKPKIRQSLKQQLENGVEIEKISCAEGLELVMKKTNGSPACVKPKSVARLVERGWAIHVLPEYVKDENNTSEMFDGGSVELITEFVDYDNTQGYLARPSQPGDYPGVVMIHEWWGLNDNIKQMARELASHGYVVLAVDLYQGEVAKKSEEARALISSFDSDEGVLNMNSAITFLEENYNVNKIGSIGWCFGGGQSLNLALNNNGMDATVIYYGQLVSEKDKLSSINWPILGIFAELDQGIPVSSVNEFENALDELGIQNEIYIYPDVDHAFANPSGDRYAPEATQDAWGKTLTFFEENLK